jgi:TRAP-type C4-dicarboxylate transport system permease small subunit
VTEPRAEPQRGGALGRARWGAQAVAYWAIRSAGVVGGIMMTAIMLLIVVDVTSRSFLGGPVHAAIGLATIALVGSVYLGMAEAHRTDRHVSVGMVVVRLPPRWASVAAFLRQLLTVVAVTWMTYAAYLGAMTSISRREMRRGAIDLPVWPGRLLAVVGLLLLLVAVGEKLLRWDVKTIHEQGFVDPELRDLPEI